MLLTWNRECPDSNRTRLKDEFNECQVCAPQSEARKKLPLNERGESVISYADHAIAMVYEIVSGSHIQENISVVRK